MYKRTVTHPLSATRSTSSCVHVQPTDTNSGVGSKVDVVCSCAIKARKTSQNQTEMKITAYLLVSVCISLTTVLSGGAENGGRSGNETEDSDGRGRNPGLRVDGSPSSEPFPLQFSFVTTYGGGVGYADLSIPAMSLAVEHVNANSSVLPNFRLSYNLNKPFKVTFKSP